MKQTGTQCLNQEHKNEAHGSRPNRQLLTTAKLRTTFSSISA
ncbi:MAG: hypothetical protein RRX93_07720 [Bacteroidales bacterium]